MSDSAHLGDAARLEAALERIVGALGRATPRPISPDPAATPEASPPDEVTAAVDVRSGPASAGTDIAQIGARLDSLIAELRGVLGEDTTPPGAPSHP